MNANAARREGTEGASSQPRTRRRRSCTRRWPSCTARRSPTLAQALEHPETRTEASEALRGLIDAIVLTPNQGELQIELKGNLAAMLGAAQNAKRSPETGDLSLQVVMVAGARNPLNLEFSWSAA